MFGQFFSVLNLNKYDMFYFQHCTSFNYFINFMEGNTKNIIPMLALKSQFFLTRLVLYTSKSETLEMWDVGNPLRGFAVR